LTLDFLLTNNQKPITVDEKIGIQKAKVKSKPFLLLYGRGHRAPTLHFLLSTRSLSS
jgi:hypothetical protein